MDPQTAQQVETIQKRIKMRSRINTAQAHVLKAKDYLQLEKLTKDDKYLHEAIDSYNKALQLKKDAVIFCERAKALNMIGESEKAVDDFRQAQALSSKEGQGDLLKNIHTKGMLKEIAKLDSVKTVINKMRAQNKLPVEFLGAFEQLTNTTQRLVMKIGLQQQKIAEQGELIRSMAKKIEQLQQKMSQKVQKKDIMQMQRNVQKINLIYHNFEKKMTKDVTTAYMQTAIDQLKTELKALGVDVRKVQVKVQQVEIKLDKFIHHSQKEFQTVKNQIKKLKKSIKAFNGKFQYIQGEINSLNQKIIFIDQTLKQGLYPKMEVKKKFQQWQKNNPLLYQYANNFYWVLTNYLLSYRIASTGIFDAKQANPDPSFAQENFSTILDIVCKGLEMIPFVSGIVETIRSVIQKIFQKYQERKSDMIIRKINGVIMKYKLQEDLSIAVGQGVIALCKMQFKLVQIDDLKNKRRNQDKNVFVKALDQFYGQVDFAIKKWNQYKIQDQSEIHGLVVQDVTALLVYILQQNIDEKDPVLISITEGFKGGYQSPICKSLQERYKDKVSKQNAKNSQQNGLKINNQLPKFSQQQKKPQQVKEDCCLIY